MTMLEHGGQLRQAVKHFKIPLENWIDLSTGINPNGFPIPTIPLSCWQRLPESNDGLLEVAQHYYQAEDLLAVAGSQAAIQGLPLLYPPSKVGVLAPAYAEHAACWQQAGHQLVKLTPTTIEAQLDQLKVLILINPNNPTGHLFSPQQLLEWHKKLQRHQGVLIIDEAFIDTCPENSLCSLSPRSGLIILRSIGKFFGLAGIRCGFVIAERTLLTVLEQKLGVWPLSHPSRYLATQALMDSHWQQQTLIDLPQQGERLRQLLQSHGLMISGGHPLFQWVKTPKAKQLYQILAQQGVLVRLFTQPESLRVGLPKNDAEWQKLTRALLKI
ncbi:MAG: threonine-phosphate decarboxylase CobD [Methylococcales bacterium]|nr:threonine-phosphate decarboxylase CobD [Methylococcales bacterium]